MQTEATGPVRAATPLPAEAAGAVRATTALPEGAPSLPPRISWGAVLAGGIVAAAIAATLNILILGAAIGATTVDAVGRATPGASSLGIGAAVWLVVANTVALAVGGYTAARLSGTSDDTDGVLHGLAVWAVAFLVSAALLGNMVAGLASTAASTVSGAAGGAAGGVGSMVSAAAGQANPTAVMDRAVNALRGTGNAPGRMAAEQRTAEISSLLAGRAARGGFTGDELARLNALVAAEAGVPAEEANRRVQAVEADVQRTAAETARQAREAADATARAASIGAFGTFAALLLGAIAAVLGARRGTREWVTARLAPAMARRPA